MYGLGWVIYVINIKNSSPMIDKNEYVSMYSTFVEMYEDTVSAVYYNIASDEYSEEYLVVDTGGECNRHVYSNDFTFNDLCSNNDSIQYHECTIDKVNLEISI